MGHLDPRERQCLARIAEREVEDIGPCDDGLIYRLLSLGLIEETVEVRVPLPMVRRSLRITVAGRAALDEHG
jgi:hypothetical protein